MSIMSDLQAIADAIRNKTGKTDSMTLSEMAGEIAQISGGGVAKWRHMRAYRRC